MIRYESSSTASSCLKQELLLGEAHPTLNPASGLVDTAEKRAAYARWLLERLCTDIGPHPSGTPGYDRAASIVKRELEQSLPVVEVDTFEVEKWELLGEPEFSIGAECIESYLAYGSPGTPPGGIHGMLKRTEADAPYGLVDSSTSEVGALVTISAYGRAVPSYHGMKTPALPRFDVGKQDAPLLEKAVDERAPVRARALVQTVPNVTSQNVIGTLPGRRRDEVLFLAHLDTQYNSPGALDNTASVIVMLMLAHAASATTYDCTLRFVATGAEEYGLLGARHYAEVRESDGTMKDIRIVVNFDSLTYGPNLWVTTIDQELKTVIEAIHKDLRLGGKPIYTHGTGFILDGEPFKSSGGKAIDVNSRGYDQITLPLWHRPEDIPANVPMDCVETSFLTFSEFIRRTANR